MSAGREAVVVLGAAVHPGGRASPALARRVAHGAALAAHAGAKAPRVLVLTGGRGLHPPAEALVMRDLALAAGVAPEHIRVEERGRSTWDSARRCAAMLDAEGFERVWVVTDAYHLRRSLFAFRCFGVRGLGSAPPAAARVRGDRRAHVLLIHLRETTGLVWYALRALLGTRAD